jgi:hypothetical protein
MIYGMRLQVLADMAGDVPSYTKKVPFYILVLVSLTSTSTWRLVRSKALAPLAPHMNQICVSVVGHLIEHGLMGQLKAVLLTGKEHRCAHSVCCGAGSSLTKI